MKSANDKCKFYGIKNSSQLSKRVGKDVTTVNRWSEDNPKLFDAALKGVTGYSVHRQCQTWIVGNNETGVRRYFHTLNQCADFIEDDFNHG